MIAGAMLAALGVFLPWARVGGATADGLDDYVWLDGFTLYEISSPGVLVLVGAAIMVGLGVTTLIAGRLLAVAILGIIGGALGVIGGLIEIGIVAVFLDSADGSFGVGVLMQPVAPIISLVGAVIVTARRTA